jgi:hypothetical protein
MINMLGILIFKILHINHVYVKINTQNNPINVVLVD